MFVLDEQKKDRHVESPFFHVNRPWGVVNAILAWPVTEKYPVRVHGPHQRKRLRSSVLMRFQRFHTFVFLIPDSSVGTAPHLILELVGLQIVM